MVDQTARFAGNQPDAVGRNPAADKHGDPHLACVVCEHHGGGQHCAGAGQQVDDEGLMNDEEMGQLGACDEGHL